MIIIFIKTAWDKHIPGMVTDTKAAGLVFFLSFSFSFYFSSSSSSSFL